MKKDVTRLGNLLKAFETNFFSLKKSFGFENPLQG
jgi:hypothetical protein